MGYRGDSGAEWWGGGGGSGWGGGRGVGEGGEGSVSWWQQEKKKIKATTESN